MSKNTTLTNFKYITVILSAIIVVMSAYIVKNKFQQKDTFTTILENKDSLVLLNDLEFLKSKYDQTISENINLSEEILIERDRVVTLIEEIKSKNVSIKEYHNKLLDIKSKMIFLFDENFKLRNNLKNSEPVNKNVETNKENKKLTERNKFLEKELETYQKTSESASKLTFLNFNATSYKVKSSGKIIASESANKANILVINYTINQNQFAKPGIKQLYFQIIDPENKVVGETKETTISEKALLYTFTTKIAYNNKTEDFSQQLPFDKFIKGKYQITIFDEEEVLAETFFEMK